MSKNDKICFFVSPIGKVGSPTRRRSDLIRQSILDKVLPQFNYSCIRGDEIDKSGNIVSQVIEQLCDADLVIADLTGGNPNVFYELAIRHCTRKPCIMMSENIERIPFDIDKQRCIKIDKDIINDQACIDALSKQIKDIEKSAELDKDNPVASRWEKFSNIITSANDGYSYRGENIEIFKRNVMIESFSKMWDEAELGDEIWVQGVRHTAYPKDFIQQLRNLIDRGVNVKVIVNENSSNSEPFRDELNKLKPVQQRTANDCTIRIHGLEDKAVIFSLQPLFADDNNYQAVWIKDKSVVEIFKKWFYNRFVHQKETGTDSNAKTKNFYDIKAENYKEKYGHDNITHIHTGIYDTEITNIGNLSIPETKELFFHGQERLCQNLCKEFESDEYKVILDCGCGYCGSSIFLAERTKGKEIHALTLVEEQYEKSKKIISDALSDASAFVSN